MLTPPETFNQLRALLWAGPSAIIIFLGLALYGFGVPPRPLITALSISVFLVLPAIIASIWLSRFSWRHTLAASAIAFLLILLPLAFLSLSIAGIQLHKLSLWSILGIGLFYATILSASATTHGTRCHVNWKDLSANSNDILWQGTTINIRKCEIQRSTLEKEGGAVSTVTIAAASIAMGGLLKNTLELDYSKVLVFAALQSVILWFLVSIMGRSVGQALKLRKIEKKLNCTFSSDQLSRLEKERQRNLIGRVLRKRFKLR